MNDQHLAYQCCDKCTPAKFAITMKDKSVIAGCGECSNYKALVEVCDKVESIQ